MSNATPPHLQSPLSPLPPIVWVLVLPVIAVEVVLGLGSAGLAGGPEAVGWRLQALERFAFAPPVLAWMWETGRWPLAQAVRLVTYPFIHGGVTHALFTVVLTLALGKMVGEVFRAWGVLLVFLGAAVAGAIVYTLVGVERALFGGNPAVFGLVGAFTFLLWTRLAAAGANRLRAFALIAVLLAVQFVFGVLFGAGPGWIADVTGFAAGFALSFVATPGGIARVIARLRDR